MVDLPGDTSEKAQQEPHFLEDPEVRLAFRRMLDEFSRETDRGSVLVAAEIVSIHLGEVIAELVPEAFKEKRAKEGRRIGQLLKYPGLLSNFAARADVAYIAGFIGEAAHRSIDRLRDLRNKAAHSRDAFTLADHRPTLRAICELGPGTSTAVNEMALHGLLQTFINGMMTAGIDLQAQLGSNPFTTPGMVIDYLSDQPEVRDALEDRLPRMELAIGVFILLGLVNAQRRKMAASRSVDPQQAGPA